MEENQLEKLKKLKADPKEIEYHRKKEQEERKEFEEHREQSEQEQKKSQERPLGLVKKPKEEFTIALEEDEEILKKVQVADDIFITLTNKGLYRSKLRKKGNKYDWHATFIYSGPFRPIERLLIDGTYVYRYKSDFEDIDNLKNIFEKMKMSGGVLSKNLLEDCVSAVCSKLPTKTGHATPGVYVNDEKMKLCLKESMPIRDEQKTIKNRTMETFEQPLTKEYLQPYFELLPHWHPYEIYPSMGISVMSPFALEFRKRHILVVVIWHHSPIPRLGKSTVIRIFSYKLFNIYPTSGDGIDSKFRFASAVDSINCFKLIDEANAVNWDYLQDLLKSFPENYICSSRGNQELKLSDYKSRAVLGITTNTFKPTSKSMLARIFKIEFDGTKVSTRGGNKDQVNKLRDTISKLEPIGWRLVELELERYDFDYNALLKQIEEYRNKISDLYPDISDPRRLNSWAIIYEGLKLWEYASIKYGCEWRAPTLEVFINDVVKKIELFGEESEESPLNDFLDWWEMWKANLRNLIYLHELYTAGKTIFHGDKKYDGDVITTSILRIYKSEKGAQVSSMGDLATAIQSVTGIPKEELLKNWAFKTEKEKDGSTKRISKHGLFIPCDIWKFKGMEE